jgi:hypothetical protein
MVGTMVYPKDCSRGLQQEFGFKVDKIDHDGSSTFLCGIDKEGLVKRENILHCTQILSK